LSESLIFEFSKLNSSSVPSAGGVVPSRPFGELFLESTFLFRYPSYRSAGLK